VSRGDGTRSIDRVPVQDLSDTYYVSLLRFLGCTSEASADAALNGGDELALYKGLAPSLMGAPSELIGWMLRRLAEGQPPLTRARALGSALTDPKGAERSIRAHCEVGRLLARRIGLGDSVLLALECAFERWDGKGLPNGIAGEEIPASCRVAIVARDFELLSRTWEPDAAMRILRGRKGRAYELRVLEAAIEHGPGLIAQIENGALWDAVLEAEPGPQITIENAHIDVVLSAFAHFVDLKSPYLHGHSSGVAELAERAAALTGLDPIVLRRAALVHDLGRVGAEQHLEQGEIPVRRRVGASAPSPILHAANSDPMRVPQGSGGGCELPSRAHGWFRLPPRDEGTVTLYRGTATGDGRRVPCHDRTTPAPRSAVGEPRRRGARTLMRREPAGRAVRPRSSGSCR
jgi:hypothetical protein